MSTENETKWNYMNNKAKTREIDLFKMFMFQLLE